MASTPSFTTDWLHHNHELYTAATNHTFIASIRDGSIDVINFKHWMEQDYHFVREFVRFVASVLLKVPRDAAEQDFDLILGGITALESEIAWFRKEARIWDVLLENVNLLEPNKDYCKYLQELENVETPYAVAVAAFWMIELVYCASFMSCLEEGSKTPFELLSTVKRWGSPEFHDYTLSLQKLADKTLENTSEIEQKQAKEVLVRILELEVKFWDMATMQTG
jgi:thiaminase